MGLQFSGLATFGNILLDNSFGMVLVVLGYNSSSAVCALSVLEQVASRFRLKIFLVLLPLLLETCNRYSCIVKLSHVLSLVLTSCGTGTSNNNRFFQHSVLLQMVICNLLSNLPKDWLNQKDTYRRLSTILLSISIPP